MSLASSKEDETLDPVSLLWVFFLRVLPVQYTALVLSAKSKQRLRQKFGDLLNPGWEYHGDHVTLCVGSLAFSGMEWPGSFVFLREGRKPTEGVGRDRNTGNSFSGFGVGRAMGHQKHSGPKMDIA